MADQHLHAGWRGIQRAQDVVFCLGVHSTQTVVQQKQLRLPNQGARHAQSLLLTTAEVHATFPKQRVVAMLKPFHIRADSSLRRGLLGRHGRVVSVAAKFDVVSDGVAEQEDVLRNVPHVASKRRQVPCRQSSVVELDLPMFRVHDAHDEPEDRRFA